MKKSIKRSLTVLMTAVFLTNPVLTAFGAEPGLVLLPEEEEILPEYDAGTVFPEEEELLPEYGTGTILPETEENAVSVPAEEVISESKEEVISEGTEETKAPLPEGTDGFSIFADAGSDDYSGVLELPELPDTESVLNDPEKSRKRGSRDSKDGDPELPVSYNSVSAGILPALRNQGSNDICWSYSSTAAIETDLIRKGLKEKSVDLSEMHTAYFTHKYNIGTVDPLGGTEGDQTDMAQGRGNARLALQALANWTGSALEADYPSGRSITSGYSIPASEQYGVEKAHVQGIYTLPNSRDEDVSGNRTLIKKYIRSHGAVIADYFSSKSYYQASANSYYNSSEHSVTHSVAIVGWDDTFPKENFSKEAPGDGAWLVRNSWMASEEPSYSYEGYFWMSYYEQTLSKVFYALDAELSDNYKHNYQYDGADVYSYRGLSGTADSVKAANVFTLHGNGDKNEILKAASFETCNTVNADYLLQVYGDLKDPNDPESGTLIASVSGKTECNGYYTVPLPAPKELPAGTVFSVVVTLTKEGGTPCVAREETLKNNWINITAASKAGESFYYRDGAWADYGASGTGNIRIKAFTDDSDRTFIRSVVLEEGKETMNLGPGKTYQLSYELLPHTASGYTADFRSSDPSILTVDAGGLLTAVSNGTADVTLTVTQSGAPAEQFVKTIRVSVISDPYLEENSSKYQWHIKAVRADDAWNRTTGNGVTVALLDSGVIPSGDLEGKIKASLSMTGGEGSEDPLIHGTPNAGIIAAKAGNQIGGAGIAPDAMILSIRVMPGNSARDTVNVSNEVLIRALKEAMKPENGVDIINMSFMTQGKSDEVQKLIDKAYEMGILCVAAAGNNGSSAKGYPASYDHVLAVGAYTQGERLLDQSNFGDFVDIAAPGSRIFSTGNNSGDPYGYNEFSMTSVAAPMVSGTAALLYAADTAAMDRRARTGKDTERIMSRILLGADRKNYSNARGNVFGGINAVGALDADPGQSGGQGSFILSRLSGTGKEVLGSFAEWKDLNTALSKLNDANGDYLIELEKDPEGAVSVALPKKAASVTFAGTGTGKKVIHLSKGFTLNTDVSFKSVLLVPKRANAGIALNSHRLILEDADFEGFQKVTGSGVSKASSVSLNRASLQCETLTGIGSVRLANGSLLSCIKNLKAGELIQEGKEKSALRTGSTIKKDSKGNILKVSTPVVIYGDITPADGSLCLEVLQNGDYLKFSSTELVAACSGGIRLAKGSSLPSGALFLSEQNSPGNGAEYYKSEGYLLYRLKGIHEGAQLLYRNASGMQISSNVLNLSGALSEINFLQQKRDYTIRLKDISGDPESSDSLLKPGRLVFPKSKYVGKLKICSADDSEKQICYTGNLALSSDTEFENVKFVPVRSRNKSFEPCDEYQTAKWNAGGHELTIRGKVSISTPLKLSGGGKQSCLRLSGLFRTGGSCGFRNTENPAEPYHLIAGSVTGFERTETGGKKLVLSDYRTSASGSAFASPSFSTERMTIDGGKVFVVSDENGRKSLLKITDLTVSDGSLCSDGKILLKNLSLSGKAQLQTPKDFSVTGQIACNTDRALLSTARRSLTDSRPYLNLSGTVSIRKAADGSRERNRIRVAVYAPAKSAAQMNLEKPVILEDQSGKQKPDAKGVLLLTKNASPEQFVPDPACIEPDKAYYLRKTDGKICYCSGN